MNIFINKQDQRLRAGWRLLIQFILLFLLTGLLQLGIQQFWNSSSPLLKTVPSFLGFIASVWIAGHFLDKRSFKDFGLEFDRRWRNDFFMGTLIGTGAMSVIFLIEWSSGWISVSGFGWQATSQGSFGWSIGGSFLAMLMVGFHEELFSRGYQILNLSEGLHYPQLGTTGSVILSVLATSLLFGSLHLFNPNASSVSTFNIVLAGIALAIPYIFTGSLGLSVGLHFSWNFVQGGVFGFPISGMQLPTSLIRISQGGTNLWTGGAFGPEAGLVGVLGIAIIAGLSCVYIKETRGKLEIAERFDYDDNQSLKSGEHKA